MMLLSAISLLLPMFSLPLASAVADLHNTYLPLLLFTPLQMLLTVMFL
jgi:hypothetical protein